jgi:hypothetical protein
MNASPEKKNKNSTCSRRVDSVEGEPMTFITWLRSRWRSGGAGRAREPDRALRWAVRVDPSSRVSYVRLSGDVALADFRDAQRALTQNPQFDAGFPVLIDLRAVTELQLTSADIRALATTSPIPPSTRRAILVGSESVYGMARMYELVRESETSKDVVRACKTVDAAAAWLGVAALDA